jgi:hypothetical protein
VKAIKDFALCLRFIESCLCPCHSGDIRVSSNACHSCHYTLVDSSAGCSRTDSLLVSAQWLLTVFQFQYEREQYTTVHFISRGVNVLLHGSWLEMSIIYQAVSNRLQRVYFRGKIDDRARLRSTPIKTGPVDDRTDRMALVS